MTTRHLLEAASLIGESASADGTWKVRLISEGKGSSGIYTKELLENHHSAFDNLLSFRNHPTGWDGPEARDFTMIAGEIVGKTWIETDERGLTSVMANYLPDPEHRDKLERYRHKLGLSIFIEGSGYEDENGDFVVDWFNPADPFGSVDVVIAPGARGKFMESAKKAYASVDTEAKKPSVTSAQDERKQEMDKEVLERLTALTTAVEALVAKEDAVKAEAVQAEADEEAARKAVDAYDEAVTAIDKAELPEKVVESLRKQAKEGVDVTPLIEQAVEMQKALEESVSERLSEGREISSLSRKVESATDLGKVFG